MSSRHRTAALAAAVGLLAIVAILVLVPRDGADSPLDVTTAPVTTGTVARRVMSTGTLQPVRTVDVGAQVSGTIHSIEADFNDRVRAGRIVARLDPSIYESQLGEAQARLEQAQAERERLRVVLDDARAKLGRSETLATESLVPRAELDLAKTAALHAAADVKGADAAIASARASITQARVSLNHTVIRSPIDGIVISRHVDVGQTIASAVQTPVLFTIADLSRMQLLAEVAEADVGGVQPGSRVSFQIESIGQQAFDGTYRPCGCSRSSSRRPRPRPDPRPQHRCRPARRELRRRRQRPRANQRQTPLHRVDPHHRPLRPSLNPRSLRRAPAQPLRVHNQVPRRPAAES